MVSRALMALAVLVAGVLAVLDVGGAIADVGGLLAIVSALVMFSGAVFRIGEREPEPDRGPPAADRPLR